MSNAIVFLINVQSKNLFKLLANDESHVQVEKIADWDENAGIYRVIVPSENAADRKTFKVTISRFSVNYREIDYEKVQQLLGSGNANPAAAEMITPDGENQTSGVGLLIEPSAFDDFDRLVLFPSTVESITTGLKTIEMRKVLDEDYGLSEIEACGGKLALNFYGPPGTGKTAAARATAKRLGKKLYQVDYASMISKWVGDTGKHIRAAFKEASELDAVLFFDEADSMLSRRIELTEGDVSNSINQNRNILMQELDRFNNIVIFATNFFQNYDEALLRRIAEHVKFELPNTEMRKNILELKIPKAARAKGKVSDCVNLDELAEETKGFSGSDLQNVVREAIKTCGTQSRQVDQATLLAKVDSIAQAKKHHAGKTAAPMGFGTTEKNPKHMTG